MKDEGKGLQYKQRDEDRAYIPEGALLGSKTTGLAYIL